MNNYDYIMKNMTLEKYAELRIFPHTIWDWGEEFDFWGNDNSRINGVFFNSKEAAIADEIKYLKKEKNNEKNS